MTLAEHKAAYLQLSGELDDLIEMGGLESSEAELLRERMEPHWYGMGYEAQTQVRDNI